MSQIVPMTKKGYAALKEQLHKMKTVDRPKVVKAIEEARGHGDLSENAEYDEAKNKQGLLEARIANIESQLAQANVIDPTEIDDDKIMFGATVTLNYIDDDEERVYMIVGEDEADLKKKQISINSPLARALIGKRAGDYIDFEAPGGYREIEVIKVEYK